jgi:hypothetical protein
MSANLDPKDKVTLDKNPPEDGPIGKINLDPTDSQSVVDHFSKLNPGDKGSCKLSFTLDEFGEKSITLSIDEIEIEPKDEDEDEATPPADDEETPDDSDEPAAVKVMKNDDGVPEQEGNTPSDAI